MHRFFFHSPNLQKSRVSETFTYLFRRKASFEEDLLRTCTLVGEKKFIDLLGNIIIKEFMEKDSLWNVLIKEFMEKDLSSSKG